MNTRRALRWTDAATGLLLVLLSVVACVPGLVVRWKIVETLDTFDRTVSSLHTLPALLKPGRGSRKS
ncbi:MAG: hypothetical protein U1F52_21400 [Burkholderiales bacterium]